MHRRCLSWALFHTLLSHGDAPSRGEHLSLCLSLRDSSIPRGSMPSPQATRMLCAGPPVSDAPTWLWWLHSLTASQTDGRTHDNLPFLPLCFPAFAQSPSLSLSLVPQSPPSIFIPLPCYPLPPLGSSLRGGSTQSLQSLLSFVHKGGISGTGHFSLFP